MPTDLELAARLQRIWDDCLPHQSEIGERVIARYAEPHRRYHTQQHLADVLARIEELADDQDLFLVRLAAFFHDAVYAIPPGQVPNEEASARLARRELSRAGLEQEDLNEIARLVRLTATHLPGPRDPEGELLCDADLAVLAGNAQEYARYARAIAEEYAALPREEFLAGRLDVLSALAERELFRTAKGRLLADRARENLAAEYRSVAEELGVDVEGSPA